MNFLDVGQRRGTYPREVPFTLGVEGAGVVESVGEGVSNVKPSDRVAFTDQPGAYSEAILADAERLIPLRKSIRPTRVKGQLRQHLGSLLFVKPLSIARLR